VRNGCLFFDFFWSSIEPGGQIKKCQRRTAESKAAFHKGMGRSMWVHPVKAPHRAVGGNKNVTGDVVHSQSEGRAETKVGKARQGSRSAFPGKSGNMSTGFHPDQRIQPSRRQGKKVARSAHIVWSLLRDQSAVITESME
jgi:hypothetical protein